MAADRPSGAEPPETDDELKVEAPQKKQSYLVRHAADSDQPATCGN